ncbi:MAG: hypothetical protein LBJ70_02150 [Holosporales bacterium]|jgi:ribonuclease-3|nr:hypothetical protein [Holosporales bacterium]
MAQDSLERLFEQKLHYSFKDHTLLWAAVQHPVLKGENKDFERLEFLGDRILGASLAEILYSRYPEEKEGALAMRIAHLGSSKTLAVVMREAGIEDVLTSFYPPSVFSSVPLEDVCEGLLGAVHLDGGFSEAFKVVQSLWDTALQCPLASMKDAKSALQELLQEQRKEKPVYQEVARTGPDHHPLFQVQVASPQDGTTAIGSGPSKQSAEQAAAAALLQVLQQGEGHDQKV